MIYSSDCAFPFTYKRDSEHVFVGEGLTKREYFAALAMQGMLALSPVEGQDYSLSGRIRHCVVLADMLIEALNREESK